MIKKIIRENRWTIFWLFFTGISVSALSPLGVHLFQRLLDQFAEGSLTLDPVFLYAGVAAAEQLMAYFQNSPYAKLENELYLSFKLFALEKMRTVRYASYQCLGTGQLVQRIENGAQSGRDILFGFYFRLFWELLPGMLFSLFFIAAVSKTIVAAVLCGYIVVFLLTKLLLRYLYRVKESILLNEEFLNHRLVRGFLELAVFRVNRRFEAELRDSRKAADEITTKKTRMLLIHEAFFALFALLVTGLKAAVLLYGLFSRSLSVGEIVALVTLLDKAYTPIAIFNVLYVRFRLDLVAYRRFEEIMALPDDNRLLGGSLPAFTKGRVELDRLSCFYGEKAVLRNVSLQIPGGSSVALVGESGSGKSTLLKLAAGLLEPSPGMIWVDGNDLAQVDLNRYYEAVTYISQESPIFDGTLRENLVFDQDVEEETLLRALSQVELQGFFRRLPDGFDTPLGEKGVTLSGGERQRLALARLWFQSPRLVLLDEATSALDSITEERVMANVFERLKETTVIAIAHRLKSVQDCDCIYAFQQGQVREAGSFEELLHLNGYFASLWRAGQAEEQ